MEEGRKEEDDIEIRLKPGYLHRHQILTPHYQ